jgi:hypothetical protein
MTTTTPGAVTARLLRFLSILQALLVSMLLALSLSFISAVPSFRSARGTPLRLAFWGSASNLLSSISAAPLVTSHRSPVTDLVAHEWGTFTSIAGPDGRAIAWLPLTGPSDLPHFVEHLANTDFKGGLRGTIRMETPVLYFYSPRETTVSVHVTFSKGFITEWYPRASVPAIDMRSDFSLKQKRTEGAITWNNVHIQPGDSTDFPTDTAASHYYAARETSAAPLTLDTPIGPQRERFLFYRGVSAIQPPLTATIAKDRTILLQNGAPPSAPANDTMSCGDNPKSAVRQTSVLRGSELQLRHTVIATNGLQPLKTPNSSLPSGHKSQSSEPDEIPAVILFERRGANLGYRVLGPLQDQASLNPPPLDGSLGSLSSDLEGMLVSQGLFADEAHAMLETWRDSWFEEGSRVIYILPRRFIDSVLPLIIHPAPEQATRVFVGRLELVTPATQQAVESAFATNDHGTLAKYHRFLEPILDVMIQQSTDQAHQDRLSSYLNSAYSISYSKVDH